MERVKYITTAIVYPNSRMHVGFAWECLGADWLVRSYKLFGEEVYFTTGTDEHAINVYKSAQAEGLDTKVYCDNMAKDMTKVLTDLGVSYDRFIRTSDEDHHNVVKHLVTKAFDKGDIYKGRYEGHYCESCEAYYTEKDITDNNCPVHKTKTRWISEENYFFKLSKYQDRLLELFNNNPNFLEPENRRNEILNVIKGGLKDFSISRAGFNWGIPLPFDNGHTVYVWFDALINYLTSAGIESELEGRDASVFKSRWPATLHVVGKDITRFHCIYWPAMLMSLEIPLPERVFGHGFINLKGEKMSKSRGNFITPDEVMKVTGPDPLRYFLLAENNFSKDGNFSWDLLINRVNADLANDFGNLVNRSISMTRKYFPDETLTAPSKIGISKDVVKSFEGLLPELKTAVEKVESSEYISACLARSRVLNLFVNESKPWVIAKSDDKASKEELKEVLYTLLEGVRHLATALLPVVPFQMPGAFEQLGVSCPKNKGGLKELSWGEASFKPNQPKPIYPRLQKDE